MSLIGVIIIGLCMAAAGFVAGVLSGIVIERDHIQEQLLVQGYKLKFDRFTNKITIERMYTKREQ